MMQEKDVIREKVTEINRLMREGLCSLGGIINSPEDASPYVLNASFPDYLGENLLNYLSQREIYVSTGSACSSKKPSPVMTAIGKGEFSRNTLRFSFCGENSLDEVPVVLKALNDALNEIAKVR